MALIPPVSACTRRGFCILGGPLPTPDRAVLFIDGNNWYHALREKRISTPGDLDYAKVSQKLVVPRLWVATRYYIGQMDQSWNAQDYAHQRGFLSRLTQDDPRISVHLGRLERRTVRNDAARELRAYLSRLTTRLDINVYQDLMQIARRHDQATVLVEKAVDVKLAVDMVEMAREDEFDAAYVLSADGDFTPAVESMLAMGKKVYPACPNRGWKLKQTCGGVFIELDRQWFQQCYRK